MPAEGEGIATLRSREEAGANRVAVDVSDDREKVLFPLDDDALAAVLNETSRPVMANIEPHGVARRESAHER